MSSRWFLIPLCCVTWAFALMLVCLMCLVVVSIGQGQFCEQNTITISKDDLNNVLKIEIDKHFTELEKKFVEGKLPPPPLLRREEVMNMLERNVQIVLKATEINELVKKNTEEYKQIMEHRKNGI